MGAVRIHGRARAHREAFRQEHSTCLIKSECRHQSSEKEPGFQAVRRPIAVMWRLVPSLRLGETGFLGTEGGRRLSDHEINNNHFSIPPSSKLKQVLVTKSRSAKGNKQKAACGKTRKWQTKMS